MPTFPEITLGANEAQIPAKGLIKKITMVNIGLTCFIHIHPIQWHSNFDTEYHSNLLSHIAFILDRLLLLGESQ